jgi:hypothetical protein
MHRACAFGQVSACRVLLKYGARATYINNMGLTPIDVARKSGHFGCAEIIEDSLRIQIEMKDVGSDCARKFLPTRYPCSAIAPDPASIFVLRPLKKITWCNRFGLLQWAREPVAQISGSPYVARCSSANGVLETSPKDPQNGDQHLAGNEGIHMFSSPGGGSKVNDHGFGRTSSNSSATSKGSSKTPVVLNVVPVRHHKDTNGLETVNEGIHIPGHVWAVPGVQRELLPQTSDPRSNRGFFHRDERGFLDMAFGQEGLATSSSSEESTLTSRSSEASADSWMSGRATREPTPSASPLQSRRGEIARPVLLM